MARLLGGLVAVLLTCIVVAAFVSQTLAWQHVDTNEAQRVAVAAVILVSMYSLMVLELVDRTLAALIGAAVSVAAHSCLVGRVGMEQAVQWLDLETLSLLFGMMLIVGVLGSSGLFDYLAIWSYRKSNGRFWLLITIMGLVTGVLSAFIDNVSSMLLMSPTLIKLSQLEQIDPRPILMMMVFFCNIGGCATPVGDPPNLIVVGDPLSQKLGISFGSFVACCGPCVLMTMAAGLLYLKIVYKSKKSFSSNDHDERKLSRDDDSALPSSQEQLNSLANELEVLQLIETEIFSHPKSERLEQMQKEVGEQIKSIENKLEQNKKMSVFVHTDGVQASAKRRQSRLTAQELDQLTQVYAIRSKPVMLQSLIVLCIAIVLFFAQSIPGTNLTLGWISLFAGLTLLVMTSATHMPKASDTEQTEQEQNPSQNFERIIAGVEWSTLIFFFALFIVMEVMAKLGLISVIGEQITGLIDQLPAGNWRVIGAITIILWSSGLASACIDNVPFTSMMIKVLGRMLIEQNARTSQEPGQPSFVKALVFALVFGACYGGNGTIIGASANLITAGVSARHGYPISFNRFFKFCAPLTMIALIVANSYLIIYFVAFDT